MTHYEILGVSKNATQSEIKSAYKELIKKYHPDIYKGDKTFAEKKSQEINVAYEVLSDLKKKAEYDEQINPGPKYTYTPPETTYSYTPPKYDRPPTNYNDYRKSYEREYNYNYRYTDYHRNKSPNSTYSTTSPLEEKIINAFDKDKLVVVFLILIIYFTILIITLCQFYAFKVKKNSNTNSVKQKNSTVITNSVDTDTYTNKNDDPYEFPRDYEDFNINDYISNSDLYDIYNKYYLDQFENFYEFKTAISKEFFEYYYSLYY